ncbi:hypothetical protein OAN307_c07970 [Octadecabacter antarcticus 307]|uniref:Uncharacterized protein n=1 Tax=Octadecabacter antarcticus 307 TaxID=391626 RepID=M9R2R9_9RHOB|nr:hypothetical protein [Octadecabacter antarcticus]AGI66522.1 hypothetical protein OAN307_c07970 [Octadecabacter antarcticus 307]
MNEDAKDTDRDGLKPRKAYWSGDLEQTLTEPELDHVLDYFGALKTAKDPELRSSIKVQFQVFMVMVLDEGFREEEGVLQKAPKPSTIIKREMKQVEKACAKLDAQLAGLDPMTKSWLDQYLNKFAKKDDNNARVGLRELEKQIQQPIETLIFAAHSAEGLATSGPNYMALRIMVERLADCWEIYHGKPPINHNGRDRQYDPFLELCRKMASIADAKIEAKGVRLSSLNLSGIVGKVLKKRHSQPKE